MATATVYEIITDQILTMLDKGVVPWRRPWKYVGHRNVVTGNKYNGLNVFILEATASICGYTSALWCSSKQAARKGGKVKDDQYGQGTKIIFWKWYDVKDEDGKVIDSYGSVRYYTVYNADQIDWQDESVLTQADEVPNPYFEADPDIIMLESMPNPPEIRHGGNRAYYTNNRDFIQMPDPKMFYSDDGYYQVLFHELVHSTGHESRLDRFNLEQDDHIFGSESYSKEELIAQFGSSMLCATFGIEPNLENSAAYIASWKRALTDEPNMLIQAASKATKAVRFIMGEEEPTYA